MNKTTIIFCTKLAMLNVLVFCFTSCKNTIKTNDPNSSNSNDLALINSNLERTASKKNPDLYYGVDTRFEAYTKEDIHKAKTIYDFLTKEEAQQIAYINSVDVIIIKDNEQSRIREYGTNDRLTPGQLKLLRATEHFSHFTIRTEFKEKNTENGNLEERFFGPHITVVPQKQAIYRDGKESLITYFRKNSKESMNVIKEDKLGAIKLSFIITKEGTISNVQHDAMTTGYSSLDDKFIELIKNIPGPWIPAENSKGEHVDQELVFTFGPANGC
jgi:hypothetical protein